MANEIQELTKPPFPKNMTFKEMLSNMFDVSFLSVEEFNTICDAGEMYANGCINFLRSLPSTESRESDAVELTEE